MISFEELSKAVYEDLNGYIDTVTSDQMGYHVWFECDDWKDHDSRRRFELVFQDVVEATVTPAALDYVFARDEHPLLWQHNDEHVSMFFSSSPQRPKELVGRLYEAHQRLLAGWRTVPEYLHADSELLAGGRGLLARGPKRVIDVYATEIGNTLRFSIVAGHKPPGGYRVILFEQCYVICRSVSVIEHEKIG